MEFARKIRDLDSYLAVAPHELRLERAADHARIEPSTLRRLLELYRAQGVVSSGTAAVCPSCDAVLVESVQSKFFCDLCDCDLDSESVEFEEVFYVDGSPSAGGIEFAGQCPGEEDKMTTVEVATKLEFARIEPWAGGDYERLIVETPTLGDLDVGRLLRRLQKFGIAVLRLTAQSAEERVLTSLAKLVGPACPQQNQFHGVIKRIRPEPEGLENSGDTVADLGLHVDGTQHQHQPGLLAFQYVTEAKIGANSIFVDAARVLLDIDERLRHQLIVSLSRPDGAIFRKREMELTAPVFSVSAADAVVLRLRFDEVIQPHPECIDDYKELQRRFTSPDYQLLFRPREGDIVLFDNWRVMHARDEVLGLRQREHNRMWIANLLPNLQPKYLLGIRGLPLETLAAIKTANAKLERQKSSDAQGASQVRG